MQKIVKCEDMNSQIILIDDLLRPEKQESLSSFKEIRNIFNISKGAVVSHYNRGKERLECGRPTIINDEQVNSIITFVHENFFKKDPVSFDSIIKYCIDELEVNLNYKTLYSLITIIPQIKSVYCTPMEAERIQCDTESIDTYYCDLENIFNELTPRRYINSNSTNNQNN